LLGKENIYFPALSTAFALQLRLPALYLDVSEGYSKYFIEFWTCYFNKLNGEIKRGINKLIQMVEGILAVQFVFRRCKQTLVTPRAVRYWIVTSEPWVQFPAFYMRVLVAKVALEWFLLLILSVFPLWSFQIFTIPIYRHAEPLTRRNIFIPKSTNWESHLLPTLGWKEIYVTKETVCIYLPNAIFWPVSS
jgi:hypothetical protein